MKKIINIIALAASVLLMALSCVGTEGLDEIPDGEICMSPVLSDMTKTRAGGATNPYPDGSSFGVFAYYSTATGGQKWSDEGESYFHNHQFKKQDGVCAGVDPVYWPLSGSLIFAGYSPYDQTVDVSYNSASNTLVINDCVLDGTKDLMYFVPELDGGKHSGYGKQSTSIPVCFHHALSAVSFSMLAGAGNATVKLKEIKLSSVYHKADFSVIGGNSPNWTNKTDNKDLVVWSSDTGVVLSSESIDAVVYTIPGIATDIYITYLIEGNSDKTICLEPKDYISEWEVGKINQYDISINSIEEVVIDPSVKILPKYEGDMLTGSVVSVDLGLSQEKLDRIKNLNIFVKDSEDIVYKSYSEADNVANAISFDAGGVRLYVPSQNGQKEYNVIFSYHDGLDYRSVTKIVTPEIPTFSMEVSAITRREIARAKPAQIVVSSARLSISDAVLAEIPAKVALQFGSTSYRVFGSEKVTKSHFIDNWTTPMNVWTGDVSIKTSEISFDDVLKVYDNDDISFLVPSSYSRGNQIVNAADLKDGGKYMISHQANPTMCFYGDGSLKYMTLTNPYGFTDPSYVFIYKRDDSKIASISANYSYRSAGAWANNYEWKFLQESFSFGDTQVYYTCANGWRNSTSSSLITSYDIDIWNSSGNTGGDHLLNYASGTSGYFWGNGGTSAYKWNIYEVIDNR